MLPFSSFKLIGSFLAVFAVGAIVFAGYRYVSNLQSEVTHLTKENVELTKAKNSLQNQIIQLNHVNQDLIDERERADSIENEARTALRDLEQKLNNKQRLEREQQIEASRKASLYLKFLQNYEECIAMHFDDFTGKCNFQGDFK